jgi:hypothetical protein
MTDTITRRRALGAGAIATIAAGLLGTTTAEASPLPPVANDAPLIDQAEALVLQLEDLLIRMTERNRNNLGQLLDMMGQAAGLREEMVFEGLEDMHAYMGAGNRVMDQIDRNEAQEAQERVVAEAAAAVLAAGPLDMIEMDEPDKTLRAMVLVPDGPPRVWVNTYLIDRASAEQWARQQLGSGKRFDILTVREI